MRMSEHGLEVGRGIPRPVVVRAVEDEEDEGNAADEQP